MTANETAKVMAILQVAYPAFYGKKSVEEKRAAVSLWAELLKEYDSRLVTAAVKELIKTHSGYPPDIAAVVERIHGIEDAARGEQTNEELWILLKKAISNGYYGAEEEFQRLPEVLKRYLRSPSQLREMSGIDSDTLNTVTRGQFLLDALVREKIIEDDSFQHMDLTLTASFRQPKKQTVITVTEVVECQTGS